MFFKVSVIVPIYNVSKYICRCVEALMRQTLKEGVEFIFVDDATPDNSIDILQSVIKKYPERSEQIKIIHHLYNKGLPEARNTGLSEAQGKYILHCDSDDCLKENALELLYENATSYDADIVWCDYLEILAESNRCKRQPKYETSLDALRGMLTGKMEYNVWNKLVKRSLYVENEIKFPTGYAMGEDLTTLMLFANAEKVVYLPEVLYCYDRTNPGALTYSMSDEKMKALCYNVARVENYLEKKFGRLLELEVACLKLNLKWPFLISDAKLSSYKRWNQYFEEANRFINKQPVSWRIRLLERCAWNKQYWLIWLHYWMVCHWYYNIIFGGSK